MSAQPPTNQPQLTPKQQNLQWLQNEMTRLTERAQAFGGMATGLISTAKDLTEGVQRCMNLINNVIKDGDTELLATKKEVEEMDNLLKKSGINLKDLRKNIAEDEKAAEDEKQKKDKAKPETAAQKKKRLEKEKDKKKE